MLFQLIQLEVLFQVVIVLVAVTGIKLAQHNVKLAIQVVVLVMKQELMLVLLVHQESIYQLHLLVNA